MGSWGSEAGIQEEEGVHRLSCSERNPWAEQACPGKEVGSPPILRSEGNLQVAEAYQEVEGGGQALQRLEEILPVEEGFHVYLHAEGSRLAEGGVQACPLPGTQGVATVVLQRLRCS